MYIYVYVQRETNSVHVTLRHPGLSFCSANQVSRRDAIFLHEKKKKVAGAQLSREADGRAVCLHISEILMG